MKKLSNLAVFAVIAALAAIVLYQRYFWPAVVGNLR